jgi:hypothetical protein
VFAIPNEVTFLELADKIEKFCASCDALLSTITMMHRPMTDEEVRRLEYCCIEVLAKISSRDPRS